MRFSIVETSNTGAMREHLGALSLLEAQKQDASQREDHVRSFVFDCNQLICEMGPKFADSDPDRTLVLLSGIADCVRLKGISTTAVRAYEDKERVQAFLTRLHDLIRECQERLTPDQLEKVKQCIKFKQEERDLAELLAIAEMQQTSAELKDQLRALNAQKKGVWSSPGKTLLLVVGLPALGCSFLVLTQEELYTMTSVTLVVIGAFLALAGLALAIPSPNPKAVELEGKIEHTKEDLELFAERLPALKKQFGEGDFSSYTRLAEERTALITSVMRPSVEAPRQP